MAFDPDAYLAKEPAAAPTGKFDPDAYLAKDDEPYATDDKTGERIYPDQVTDFTPDPIPENEKPGRSAGSSGEPKEVGSTGHNIARTAVEAVPKSAAGLAGFGAGMEAVAPAAVAATAASVALVGPFAPLVGGVVELAGGLGGAWLASGAAQKATDWLHEAFAPEDFKQRQIEKQQHPYSTFGAELGTSLLGMSPKTAVEETGKFLTKPIVQRGIGATFMGGQEAVTEYVQEGEIDPAKVAAAAAAGAVMPRFNAAGERLYGSGKSLVRALRPGGTKTPPPLPPEDMPPPPKEGATKEEKEKFLKQVKKKQEERAAKAPLVETAIRNKETGEIERMGPKHNVARKEATKDTHEEGFLDENGKFHTRVEAVDQAKRSGQIPQDHVLESPEGEQPGLHSGDLRKVGDKRFEVTDKTPAGKPAVEERRTTEGKPPEGLTERRIPPHPGEDVPENQFAGKFFDELPPEEQQRRRDQLKAEREALNNVTVPEKVGDIPVTSNLDKTREDGSRVGATTKRDAEGKPTEISVDVEHLKSQFKDKPWTKPKVEGVEALPADAFKTPQEWVDFVIAHEAEHVKTPKAEGQSKADYENQTNKAALETLAAKKTLTITLEETTKLSEDTTPAVAAAAEKVDVRTIPNKEAFLEHATDIYNRYGEEEALKFFEDYKTEVAKRQIPVPNDNKSLDDALHKLDTWQQADKSEHVTRYKKNTKDGITEEQRRDWFDKRERGEELPPEAKAILDAIDSQNLALVRKAKAMGLEVGEEFTTGQSRIRIEGGVSSKWKKMISELFANRMPFSEKVADQANAAHERKVFQLNDGRVVEIHRIAEDAKIPMEGGKGKTKFRDVKKGTEIWEWVDGNKKLIGHTDNLEFKKGEEITLKDGSTAKMVDGKVEAIEEHSPYRYLHDAEASARLANMGLRKMVRDAEFLENLKKSELFKNVAHGPDEPLKTLPSNWRVPNNIDKVPQLRGYHFDPKTAAIIEDFAKVWDNNFLTGLSNQVVKNMMLNPLPHMWNEMMHLYNARGFTGWVDPRQVGRFASTAKQAWRDVSTQSKFYRDIMREGGAILGADPRNQHFDQIIMDAGKQMMGDKEGSLAISRLAKKFGTTVGDIYNGISRKSQQAMWVARDTMYVQYIREIQKMHPEMSLKDAIAKAERHMPNYRMPSEVMNSRKIAQVLKNPNVTVFSRYHYGMLKSLVNTIKDVNPKNLASKEGREQFREGADSMLAIGMAMAVGYPLMDMLAEEVFGKGAEVRRAGPYHMIKAIQDVASGEKDASALIWPIFTFNPALLVLGQLLANHKIFSGKEIYHPQDTVGEQISDVATYGAKQIPQAPGIMGVTDEGGDTSLVAKQFDVKVQTPEQRAKARTAKKRELAATKSRETKRKKGTYNP